MSTDVRGWRRTRASARDHQLFSPLALAFRRLHRFRRCFRCRHPRSRQLRRHPLRCCRPRRFRRQGRIFRPRCQHRRLPHRRRFADGTRGVAEAGGVITEDGSFRIPTPLPGGDVVITADSVAHIVQKRGQERERLARYIVPALANPAEVWLQAHPGPQGRPVYRRVFVSRFDDLDAIVIVEEIPKSADFTVTFYSAADIGRRRQGYLLYRQAEG